MKAPVSLKTLGILLMAAPLSASAATVFSFQQGDLRQDGSLFGSGATYSGSHSAAITDQTPTATTATDRLGNQFRDAAAQAGNTNYGNNGQNWVALFSYNLTELATYIASNPGMTVSGSQFNLVKLTNQANAISFSLRSTQAFSTSATWATYDGTNAWPATVRSNSTGAVGGGTQGTVLSASAPASSGGANMAWETSSDFVTAVNNALASGDKTLYMMVQGAFYTNSDSSITYADIANATVDSRPELLITLDAVPEPSTAILGALGAIVLLRRRR